MDGSQVQSSLGSIRMSCVNMSTRRAEQKEEQNQGFLNLTQDGHSFSKVYSYSLVQIQIQFPSLKQVDSGIGSWDFLGLNHYSSKIVTAAPPGTPGWAGDQETALSYDPSWESGASAWLKVVPCTAFLTKTLNNFKPTYTE